MGRAAILAVLGAGVGHASMVDSLLPLTEVVWSPEAMKNFSGTPSIIQLDGEYLVSYESFDSGPAPECAPGPGQPAAPWPSADEPSTAHLLKTSKAHWTRVLAAPDVTGPWEPRGAIQGQHFMSLYRPSWFKGKGSVLGVGLSAGPVPGNNDTAEGITVSSSTDGGVTWTSKVVIPGHFTAGATPVAEWAGRVWRAVEAVVPPGGWPTAFQSVLASAPIHRDLLDPSSWTITPPKQFSSSWIVPPWTQYPWAKPGYLEGNAVPMATGPNTTASMRVLMRVNSLPYANVGMILRLGEPGDALPSPGANLTAVRMISFPGGMSKFTVRHDALSGQFLSLTNNVTNTSCPSMRSVLTLACSPDLERWAPVATLITSDDGLDAYDTLRYTGFHYADWQFDANGQDIVAAIRTAYRGAVSYHNSNRITAYRLRDFRSRLSGCPK